MTMVWDGFPGSGSELLCMLAMADWANDAGGSVHPSIQTVANKIRVSEKQARRIVNGLVESGYMAVAGNQYGGAPGTTKQWVINVKKLRDLAAKKQQENGETPPIDVTPPMGVLDPSHGCPKTAPTGGSLSTIEPPIEPPVIPAAPTAPPILTKAQIAAKQVTGKAVAEKAAADKDADELQAACRATWAAYAEAYAARYSTDPVRNAKVNSNVKDFVKRIGREESPAVAAFFVTSINDAFVVRSCHPVGSLLQNAEAYRTQWATGRTAEATQATGISKPAQPISFADHDEMKRRRRWEEMTGRKWPESSDAADVIDITPTQSRISA